MRHNEINSKESNDASPLSDALPSSSQNDSLNAKAMTMATNAIKRVQTIIDLFGPRISGTEPCLNAAKYIFEEFQKFGQTFSDTFSVNEGAFLGWIRLMVGFYPIMALFIFLKLPFLSFLFGFFGLSSMIFEFVLYYKFIDIFFPKKTGNNVYSFIEPNAANSKSPENSKDSKQNEIENIIIFSGHHDSAHVFNIFIDHPELYNQRITRGIATFVFTTFFSLFLVFFKIHDIRLHFFVSALTFFLYKYLYNLWFFYDSDRGTPGAGDNLISTSMAAELSKFFMENRLKKTLFISASFDSEECGLRGSREFFKKFSKANLKDTIKEINENFHNKNNIIKENVTIYNINVDCPYNIKDLNFLITDINGTVRLDEEATDECLEIAKEIGIKNPRKKEIAFLTGGTDAAEAAKVGIKAVSVLAMPWDNDVRSNVYHTPKDTTDKLDVETIKEILKICIIFVQRKDK